MSILDCHGQRDAIVRLQLARQSSRVPHSYIFFGQRGVGKSLLARQWAKLQLCSKPPKRVWDGGDGIGSETVGEIDDCCDNCQDCHLVDVGTHPDLHIINRDLGRHTAAKRDRKLINLPIDVIRDFVIKRAGVFPSRGRARVFIIDEAETMSQQAQNALLKTLEEPVGNTYLVLIAYNMELLLPTVRSRCQGVRFVALDERYIRSCLEQKGVSSAEAGYWAGFCGGSLGLASELAQSGFYETKCDLVRGFANLDYNSALAFAGELLGKVKGYSEAYLKKHPDDSASEVTRMYQRWMLWILSYTLSKALRRSAGVPDSAAVDQSSEIERIGSKYGTIGSSRAIRATVRAEALIGANVNPALIFETLMLDYLGYAN